MLDGKVITAPTTQAAITDGKPEISGTFNQDSAKVLADQLKYGALAGQLHRAEHGTDLGDSRHRPTHGRTHRRSHRPPARRDLLAFPVPTAGPGDCRVARRRRGLTYLVLTIWSWREGYRLSLSGVAGLIVAIGFTADSFIVYFERIRDELRDGRGLVGAVEAGWGRAIRTILAAKSVNLLSAIILFILAVGNVQGFAFTLGVTTIIDVLIVVLFTHPVLQLLATTKFFGSGHPLSGLDPTALGAIYRGRAQFRPSVEARQVGCQP